MTAQKKDIQPELKVLEIGNMISYSLDLHKYSSISSGVQTVQRDYPEKRFNTKMNKQTNCLEVTRKY